MTIHMTVSGIGKPLVLFHGWGFDSHIWEPLLPMLGHSFQIYAVDLPGFGQTPSMTWDMFKRLLLEKLPLKFGLLGWSMGGLWATRLAIEEDRRVTALCNVASSPCFVKKTAWEGIAPETLEQFYQTLLEDPQKIRDEFMALQIQNSHLLTRYHNTPVSTGLSHGLEVLLHWDLRALLHHLKQPVCYLFGRLDTIVSKRVMSTMQAIYPNFQYGLFSKAAHVPFLSHPEEFSTTIERFFL